MRFKSRAAELVVNVEKSRVIFARGELFRSSVGRDVVPCGAHRRLVVVCKRRTTDELSFTMGGDKMVSHWENILDCADEWAHAASMSLRKVSIRLASC